MGFYIQGPQSGKAKFLQAKHDCIEIPQPKSFDEIEADLALICVVDNGPFEAAGYCFSPGEFKIFTDPEDHRPKTWLLMNVEKIILFGGNHNWRVRRLTIWGWEDAAGQAFDSRRAAEDWALEKGYHLVD